jgi:3-oxoacyl-[acyl-carrier protein] reductase
MPEPTKAKKIAILGGAGGIGRVLVDRLVEAGHEVIVLDLGTSLERYKPTVPFFAIDILSDDSITKAFAEIAAHWSQIDGFVNLAGYNGELTPLRDTTAEYFDDILNGNLRGAFLSAKACLPLMAKNGAMVMTSSGLSTNIRPNFGAYSMAKAGVISLTKTLALENAPDVRVNCVAPAAVDTAFLRGGTGRSDEDREANLHIEHYVNAMPMKRLAVPDDVVGPIMFLLSDASGYMTGQVLWVNGGSYMP